jgi:hypothetical protein
MLIGGDWNCTYSTDPVAVNIDILNMRELPNIQHSNLLLEMCDVLGLLDLYRQLHYNKVDFSFTPRSDAYTNRSRLDFFKISDSIVNNVSALQNKLFDHKAVTVSLKNKKKSKVKRPFISNKILNSEILDLVVYSTVAETYVHHALNLNVFWKDSALRRIGQIKMLIVNLGIDF